jgi:hypothetical protein
MKTLHNTMKEQFFVSRRILVKSSVLGLLSAAVPNIVYANSIALATEEDGQTDVVPHDRHPAIALSVASEVVGAAHFKFERLKELVEPRPELAKAVWDWGFGDWESAIGAASHVGNKPIIDYLLSKGAVPTIFTFAVLGQYEIVKAMIDAYQGAQNAEGPHGITLLQHAQTGLQTEGVDKSKAQRLVDYLQVLSDANGKTYLNTEEADKANYRGDYKYGPGKDDGFTINVNMQKMLSLGKLGKNGGTLLRIGEHEFTYRGAPSVRVKFVLQDGKVISLILTEPGLTLTATKV